MTPARCTTCRSRKPYCPACAAWDAVQTRSYDAAVRARVLDWRTMAKFLFMSRPPPALAHAAARALQMATGGAR